VAGFAFRRCRHGHSNPLVQFQMLFAAARAIALSSLFIAQAGQFVAATDAIAVAGCRRCLDRDQCHRISPLRILQRAKGNGKLAREFWVFHSFESFPTKSSSILQILERGRALSTPVPIRLPENKHLRLLTFPPKTGTFRAAKLPTVVPCGGVSLDESGFRTQIPVRLGGCWGLSSGVSEPNRRTSKEFCSKNSEWLECSFPAESESALDFSCFSSQVRLGLTGPSVRLGAVALENNV
jgi:hypothetical protein